MHKTDIEKLVNNNIDGPSKKIFYDQGNIKAQVVCLKSEQTILPLISVVMLYYKKIKMLFIKTKLGGNK